MFAARINLREALMISVGGEFEDADSAAESQSPVLHEKSP